MTGWSALGFWRRHRLPAGRRPPLAPQERVVAWAAGPDDAVVVATNRGLFLPGRPDRLPWHEIHKAVWSGRELVVTPAEVVERGPGYAVVADLPPVGHLLPDPRDLPRQVYTRVTRSVAYTRHHRLPGGGGVRVVGRRVSGVDGVTWTVRYDPGTDPGAPEVRAATLPLIPTDLDDLSGDTEPGGDDAGPGGDGGPGGGPGAADDAAGR